MDIAALGYEIDSSQARSAASNLLNMNRAAAQAEAGAAKLQTVFRNSNGTFKSASIYAKEHEGRIKSLAAEFNSTLSKQLQFAEAQKRLADAIRLGVVPADQAKEALERLQLQYAETGTAANKFASVGSASAAHYGKSMSDASMHTANVFAQLNDIGVMMASGQSPLVLALQQGTQLNQVWGQMGGNIRGVGAAIGGAFMSMLSPINLVTIGVIALGTAAVQWLMSSKDAALSFDDALNNVHGSVTELNNQMNIWSVEGAEAVRAKYGEIDSELAAFINRMNIVSQLAALSNTRDLAASVLDELQGWESSTENLSEIFPQLQGRVNHVIDALHKMKTAGSLDEQLANLMRIRTTLEQTPGGIRAMTSEQFKFYQKVVDSEDAIRQMVAAQPKGDFMSTAISKAADLASKLWDAVKAARSIPNAQSGANMTYGNADWTKNNLGFLLPGSELIGMPFVGVDGGVGSGAGSGGTDPYADNLQRLIESLQTEQQTVDEWYQENLTILEDRRASEILGEQAHKDALIALEQEYLDRKKGLNEGYNQFSLDSASALFGEMYSLTGSSLSGLLKLQKTFGAASALVNTYTAAAQVLADPSLGFFAKFAAVAKTVAAGMGLVNAINGGGGGGAGRAGGTTIATSATASEPNRVTRVELVGDDWLVKLAESMMTQIYDASRDGRVIVARG